MGKFIDLTNKKFGRLTVINRSEDYIDKNNRHFIYWNCICDCGKKLKVKGDSLRSGNTKSCGCYNNEKIIENNKKTKKKYNKYDLSGDYGIGYTYDNHKFYFDLEDYDKIKMYSWSVDKQGYVVSNSDFKTNNHTTIKFHRLIMNCDSDMVVDHKNHINSDNRKENLRICTNQENCMNKKILSNNTSGITGVYYNSKLNKWIARIGYKNKTYYLGCYKNKEDAIKARKDAEEKYYKKYSYNNSMKS